MMRTVIALTLLAPLLDAFDRFVERYAVNAGEHQVVPELRGIQWGTIARDRGRKSRYFRVRLPSYDWRQRRDYGPREWRWHQRHLVWTSDEGWFEWFEPLFDRRQQ